MKNKNKINLAIIFSNFVHVFFETFIVEKALIETSKTSFLLRKIRFLCLKAENKIQISYKERYSIIFFLEHELKLKTFKPLFFSTNNSLKQF